MSNISALEYYEKYCKIIDKNGVAHSPVLSDADRAFFETIHLAAELNVQPFVRNFSRRGPAYIVNPLIEQHVKTALK